MGYQAGEEYQVYLPVTKKQARNNPNRFIVKDCKIVQEHERFLVIDLGNYRDTIEKYKLQNGTVKLIKKGEDEMPREAKITREMLIEECRNNGMDSEALREIAKKHDVPYNTVRAYFNRWKIRDEINDKKPDASTSSNVKMHEEAVAKDEIIEAVVEDSNNNLLKPISFSFQGTCFIYNVLQGKLSISVQEVAALSIKEIEIIIKELQELKRYVV